MTSLHRPLSQQSFRTLCLLLRILNQQFRFRILNHVHLVSNLTFQVKEKTVNDQQATMRRRLLNQKSLKDLLAHKNPCAYEVKIALEIFLVHEVFSAGTSGINASDDETDSDDETVPRGKFVLEKFSAIFKNYRNFKFLLQMPQLTK